METWSERAAGGAAALHRRQSAHAIPPRQGSGVTAAAEPDRAARHLQLLTETIAAVNSTLDLAGVFAQIASKVAQAMGTDACFVYLYDEPSGMLELRATHGARFDDPAHRPRMAPGEGITGVAAASMRPVVIARDAHLDPRFMSFPNLPEDEYESILAVPVLARDKLAGALNVRTRAPRVFGPDEIALLSAIAGQVGQAIENAKLYERSQQRVVELEALADIGRTLSGSLYLDDALRGIATRTMRALNADGCAVVLKNEDGISVGFREGTICPDADLIRIAESAPKQGETYLAQRLQWKQRTTGALVVLSTQPRSWSPEERSLLTTIAHAASAAVANAQAALRGLLAQEIHHRVKNNLQTVASLLRLQAGATTDADASKALEESVNRILSIAAVHDLLTATREDGVDCAGLVGTLEAMLGQGLGGRSLDSQLDPVTLSGARATALALVFCELFQNAVEHGGGGIAVGLHMSGDMVELTVEDEGSGPSPQSAAGLGLTIAKALVSGELGGTLELAVGGRGKAVVRFPAEY